MSTATSESNTDAAAVSRCTSDLQWFPSVQALLLFFRTVNRVKMKIANSNQFAPLPIEICKAENVIAWNAFDLRARRVAGFGRIRRQRFSLNTNLSNVYL